MREILFRGKTKKGEWVYGLPFYTNEIIDGIESKDGKLYYVIPETVGQFTGLTDKYGTNIFEGDIIRNIFHFAGGGEREVISAIEYGLETGFRECGVCQIFKDGSGKALLTVHNESGIVDCEVIGNNYDNPELFEEKE